jgi:hypothetical protein
MNNNINLKEDDRSSLHKKYSSDNELILGEAEKSSKNPFEQLGLGMRQMFRLQRFLLVAFIVMTLFTFFVIGTGYYLGSPN